MRCAQRLDLEFKKVPHFTYTSQPVAISLPEPLADLPILEEAEFRPRETRFLPLSGKSEAALRALAGRYLSWLDERSAEASSADEAEGLLADMAWTAGVGRSHFEHRAGLVFRDGASLREGLRALEDADERPPPLAATKVAFAVPDSRLSGTVQALYETEPLARAVLDRCEAVHRQERGASLLEAMGEGDPRPATPAVLYSLECALAALWSSVGIRPGAVIGCGLGELAAAQAAGVFSLEDGLRLAAALEADGALSPDGPGAALSGIAMAPPSVSLVSSATGRVLASADELDGGHWRQACEPAALDRCAETLAGLGAQVVLEIGPEGLPGPMAARAWPRPPNASGEAEDGRGFAAAVAAAYEAGLAVSFAGLFSGETRRRITLPGYPFQRRRHWI